MGLKIIASNPERPLCDDLIEVFSLKFAIGIGTAVQECFYHMKLVLFGGFTSFATIPGSETTTGREDRSLSIIGASKLCLKSLPLHLSLVFWKKNPKEQQWRLLLGW